MPAYDFECPACGNRFEQRHPITAIPDQVRCGKCKSTAERQMSPGGTYGGATPDWQAYASVRLPKNAKGCKVTAEGRPIILNRQHEDRVLKSLGYERE